MGWRPRTSSLLTLQSGPVRTCSASFVESQKPPRQIKGQVQVPGVIEAATSRLIGFEVQFGPFAVAQLRILAELQSLLDDTRAEPAMRLFVTDTLGNPYAEEEYLPQILMPLGESRRRANEIKRQEKITVVIGNPTL